MCCLLRKRVSVFAESIQSLKESNKQTKAQVSECWFDIHLELGIPSFDVSFKI